MPDVTKFNIGGTEINVKDASARSAAESAISSASAAQSNASQALQIAQSIEELGRVTVTYSNENETITITTGNHSVN